MEKAKVKSLRHKTWRIRQEFWRKKLKLEFKIQNFSRQTINSGRDPAIAGKFLLVILIFAFYALNFIGCAAISKKDKGMGSPALLEPQITLKFSDLPVPAGFKLLPQDSYSFESAGMRVGLLKYQGKANVDQVLNFYKEQMPMYNWNLLNIIEYGERLMNFDRDTETCIINLLPKGKSITVTISLGPKPPTPKRSDKPVK